MNHITSVSFCLWTLLHIALSVSHAQTYNAPQPDFRLSLNMDKLNAMIGVFHLVNFSGTYYNGGNVCTSPDVHIQIEHPKLNISSWLSLGNGNGAMDIDFSSTFKGYTNDGGCGALGLKANCTMLTCAQTVSTELSVQGSCQWLGGTFPFTIAVPNPLFAPQSIPLTITNPKPTDKDKTFLEFGSFVNGEWKASPTPFTRSIPVSVRVSALGGTTTNKACLFSTALPEYFSAKQMGNYLIADLSIGQPNLAPFDTKGAAEAAYAIINPLNSADDIAGFSIAPQFFGDGSPGVGLFGRAVPIRVSGTHEYREGKKLEYELFLTGGKTAFAKIDGKDRMIVNLEAAQPKIWQLDDKGARIGSKPAVAKIEVFSELILSLPSVNSEGKILVTVEQFRIGLKTKIGLAEVCICPDKLDETFGKNLPVIAKLKPVLDVSLPACLYTGIDRITALKSCPGNVTKGYLSNDHLDRNKKYIIDLQKAIISVKDGRLNFAAKIQ